MGFKPLSAFICDYEFLGDFFLTQRVVLKLLRSLRVVDVGREDVMKPKLAGEHVHHNPKSRFFGQGAITSCLVTRMQGLDGCTVISQGESIKGV